MAPKRSCCIPFSCCCFSSSSSSDEKRQVDHPTSAGAPSSPSATDNTIETLPRAPKKREMAPKRSRCIRFRCCCFSSSSSSDEKGQDQYPTSAGALSSPSATDNTIDCAETLPGAPKSTEAPIPGSSNVITPMKNEIEDVDHVNLNVSGTHQRDKAPVSESLNIQGKPEGKNGNVNLNVLGAPQCNEASSSGSSNVPMKHEVEDADANLKVSGATHCDEAPSSGSPNVPVDANLNVSEAPSCNEAPSSSSSSSRVATTSSSSSSTGLIHTILHKDIEDVNIDELMKHISELLKLREEEMRQHDQRLSNPSSFPWPAVRGLNKLKAILSWGTDLEKLKELLSSGLEFVSELKDNISEPITTVLKDIGKASVATAGLLVVAYTLERFDDLSNNKETCWALIKEMTCVGTVVKRLEQSSKGMQENVIEKATALVVEGAIMCCMQIGRSAWKSFFRASKDKDDLSDMRQKLNVMYNQISIEIGLRALTECERILAAIAPRNSPVSKEYPEHAVGIEESIEEVRKLLECENEKNVVTVILHGFGGIGKTTLADAVFSQVKGGKCSEVQLSDDISSKRPDNIIQLQRKILEHLMEPEEVIPEIPKPENGRRKLGKILEKVEAFIYIDNVLDQVQLEHFLPQDLDKAKKVRFLLTARNKDVKLAFPSCTPTKIYPMEGIKNPEAALSILKNDIKSEDLDGSQFNKIIKICHGIPLMLKLVARFIGHADDKGAAYSEVMQEEEKWNNEGFNDMRIRFAYDALPEICKDPFLDICSYFKRWDWDTVENIVGKYELEMLERRALVTKDTFTGVVNVHDVILELGFHVSKGKEVRLSFTSARELKAYEKEGAAEGIKGIWLTDNKDRLQISALTLDSMHKSLRVLRLGKLTEVEDKCSKKFEELVFFEAKVPQLPFHDVSKLKQLRYLSYAPKELKLSKMPSSLRHMEFDGSSSHSHAFQISSKDPQQQQHLRILRLLNFSELENLPEELGDQAKDLQELSLTNCKSIKKLPDSISKLPSLRILKMDNCSNLTVLPVEFGSLSSLQELNLSGCEKLKALPEGFGQLKNLERLDLGGCKKLRRLFNDFDCLSSLQHLDLSFCERLDELPERLCLLTSLQKLDLSFCRRLNLLPADFGFLTSLRQLLLRGCESMFALPISLCLLTSLEKLDLSFCRRLKHLPEDFCFLTSLRQLLLHGCESLEKLPQHFHCLPSLQFLYLGSCPRLEGKSMDHVAKMNTLQVVVIKESNELVKRWVEIQSDCHGSSYPLVIFSEEKPTISENMKNSVLSELDGLLTNGRGKPVDLSHLLPNTSTLLVFDDDDDLYEDQFPWPLIEETVDDGMQMQIIYIGPHFDQLPNKVKDTIFAVNLSNDRTRDILVKLAVTIGIGRCYVQMDTKTVGDGNSDYYGTSSCWKFLTEDELEEFVVCNYFGRYLRLKRLAETNQESNIELLKELFAPDGDETTPVFQKNESSQQQDRTENFEPKTTCGVDKLKGKTVLVEMWPYNPWRSEIKYHQFWKEVYFMEKEKVDLEIISIPIVYPSKECDVIDVYKQFSREVPWLLLQNSWTVITRAVKFFLEKHGGGEERDEICEKWYPTINWIIEPNGRISVYRPSIFLKEEWEQPKHMSTLEFLFNHLESVSPQVQKLMLPGKLICLYRGGDDDEEVLYSIWNALDQQQRDRIHIIHLGRRKTESFQFTMNSKKDYYYPLKNTAEIEGMSSLNLSENEILRFSLRLCHLEKEINRMEDSELKFLLHSFQPLHSFQDNSFPFDIRMYGSIAFMDGSGKVVAALGGKILESIFDRKDRAERFIKSIMNDIKGGGGKEMHDEDPGVSDTLIQNLQTSSALDAYFDSLREYISERWEVEFYHPFRFKKEGEKRSLPRVTWLPSTGFCRLKNFLSEGINDDWVKYVTSGLPEAKDKRVIVIDSLLMDIEEAFWAVAGLLAVADILERFETISSYRMDCLFLLDKMFRMAQNIQQFNQKRPGLWRGVKRLATAMILACSIKCCCQIDESNFALFDVGTADSMLYVTESTLTETCDMMAEAITEGPSNESVSLLKELCDEFYGFGFFLESGD